MEAEVAKTLHDIRSPLNSISVNAELGQLLVGGEKIDPARLVDIYALIIKECQSCSQRIDRLQTLLDS